MLSPLNSVSFDAHFPLQLTAARAFSLEDVGRNRVLLRLLAAEETTLTDPALARLEAKLDACLMLLPHTTPVLPEHACRVGLTQIAIQGKGTFALQQTAMLTLMPNWHYPLSLVLPVTLSVLPDGVLAQFERVFDSEDEARWSRFVFHCHRRQLS